MSLWILDTDHFSLFQHRHAFVLQCLNKDNFKFE
ncbi:hypothetical protein Aazo_3323 ['Nostoc azollae' 0708]|mgnify:CR=1 FL=1|jgi:hypothetical protein|uniref:Uncharacterized protein n=1 Tax=Nostoc azollae (strain 0708) TaxID=551115 RepID=D7E2H2_NOSA0|nr:hypothetical protein Aazo_3323 ['Nostoc azollae' 0708]